MERDVDEAIEEARRSGALSLDLGGGARPLDELPEALRQLKKLQELNLANNDLTVLPEWLGELTQLRELRLEGNKLRRLPRSLGKLKRLTFLSLWDNLIEELPASIGQLRSLNTLLLPANQLEGVPNVFGDLRELATVDFGYAPVNRKGVGNPLGFVPDSIRRLSKLEGLGLDGCLLTSLPDWLAELPRLQTLKLRDNGLQDLPTSLARLSDRLHLDLEGNPLNPELAAAYAEGSHAVTRYLQAKASAQVVLNEAKLILVGEGDVGKSSLLGALRGDDWVEGRVTTHGIEIKQVKVTDPETGAQITLNGWDFGGQRVYRPTHQLFFSAPAVYLVVWKPREGPQQGFVKEWIKLVKHREPEARVIVVATHGGPQARQPDIDRQELWDLFGKETVVDFLHVQSLPPMDATGKPTGCGEGIEALKALIGKVAAGLPEMGRSVPRHWQEARQAVRKCNQAYLPLEKVFAICARHQVQEEDARVLLRICHRVGDVIHYESDPILKDMVVIKPDWLATAMSFVLDDAHTREIGHGLVSFERLGQLWNDPARPPENRYPPALHAIFLRLMERFDLSYRVAEMGPSPAEATSLIAQLVPDVRPDPVPGWSEGLAEGDEEQMQVCRIIDSKNSQSATAEGLFYQLIVRLHRYSLGRADYAQSSHWQRGLVLEDHTGARAFLEHVANDVRITVRSPYPERFLAALTYDVKWLVEGFWKGMLCEVTVPCLTRLSSGDLCKGLFEVTKLIENKRRGRPEQPCSTCNEWHGIETLLRNAPAAQPDPLKEVLTSNFAAMKDTLDAVLQQLDREHVEVIGRFDHVDAATRETISKVEAAYSDLLRSLLDEAKDGPRLFSFEPEEAGFFDRPKWVSAKFKLTLWCEHARVPLWQVANEPKLGVYTLDLPRDWLIRAAPFLKVLSTTLSLVLPVVAAVPKLALPDTDFKHIEGELALGKSTSESLLKGSDQVGGWVAKDDGLELAPGSAMQAQGAVLRQLHAWLREKDVTFGGLMRVQNRRQEFLWVHPQFAKEY